MKTVMIVEDMPLVQKMYDACLGPLGLRLVKALDGRTALRLAETTSPDLVLMDINLPDMTGVEVTRTLKGRPAMVDIPIVAVSTGHKWATPEEMRAAGFDGFIQKPINTVRFVATVKDYLGL